ncbi:hypothetical protein 65p180 [Aeromonas phage 65]|uniref:Uncharacterized protein n=2 Tax=Ishigurovirus osborne TaxID=260149 RepID=A0A219YC90_9CAUD|nr:hypothetical protein ST65p180 [Aeromonas phage 65]ADQ53188.1 hypothetical protein 65p180 [Aeromonas phage 65]APU01565.1 hypothetical protein [Aeromonas phage 65.2]
MVYLSAMVDGHSVELGYFTCTRPSDAIQYCIDANLVPTTVKYFQIKEINTKILANNTERTLVGDAIVIGEDAYQTFDNGSYEITKTVELANVMTSEEHNAIKAFKSLSKQEQDAVRKFIAGV